MIASLAWLGLAVFGALGAYARFRVATVVTSRRPSDFPFGTFVVNLTGGFLLGLLTGLGVSGDTLLVFGTGLLGGYTTFSTWMVEAERVGEDADWTGMTSYVLGSMLAGLDGSAAARRRGRSGGPHQGGSARSRPRGAAGSGHARAHAAGDG